ncbi:hypothetical protein F5883DRAFT_415528, partial [Diaporthe sp. PMI_573]
PILFYHTYYFNYKQYPNGTANIVRYWAESRILGDIIVFDQKTELATNAVFDQKTELATNAVFIHPDRDEVTYRICKLIEE